ncbi:PorH family porin [Corynebacterium guaraldiae]|uniref:PorH family porin n=2 Tax=Corynebacterium TaxID=1716 RepID=A0ABU9UJV9_9CORY|nr:MULTISPECIES: PorH family porin [Corynebacterium]MCG7260947.1 PorH family porin [Corynebacterium aurimucosum]MCL8494020.1 PorH family porin [Corynebacterium intestinale]MCP1390256.1 PorH family porin [Corynebacterium intestinale]MCZ9298954.1 PorH family porin [Corynebacterium hesseae]MDK6806593.1 PorH family porin [Corynebacterium aurimucosum]
MDLSFIGDQLGNFADFADGIKKLFGGFASVFDLISGAATTENYPVKPDTSVLEGLSSKK